MKLLDLVGKHRTAVGFGLALLIFVFIGVGVPMMGGYVMTLVISGLLFCYLAQCWNIVGGYLGRFSFGHAAFFGIGAYATVALNANLGLSPWLGILAGIAIAGALGWALAAVSFRFGVSGPYFALTTLALAEVLRITVSNVDWLGGPRGLLVEFSPDSGWSTLQFGSRTPYFYIILGLTIAVTLLVWGIDRRRFGYLLKAIREDESVASSLGVDCRRNASIATALSASLTAVGGAFYAQWLMFVEAPTMFNVQISLMMVIPVMLGGVGTVLGPLVGSILLVPIQELARSLFRDNPGVELIIYGAIIIIVLLVIPRGVMGAVTERLWRSAPPDEPELPDDPDEPGEETAKEVRPRVDA